MERMLQKTRDLRLFPMSPEQYKQFQKHAQKQKILFSAIKDRDGGGQVIDVVMPVTELDRANLIFERILYQGPTRQAPEREKRAPSAPVRGPVEPSPGLDREPPQRAQEDPQAGRLRISLCFVVWAALLLAQSMDEGLPDILANLTAAL